MLRYRLYVSVIISKQIVPLTTSQIAHPINTVVKNPTTPPTRSLSTGTKSSYTVTIHGRTHHKHTEFPNANSTFLDVPHLKVSSRDASDSSTVSHSIDPVKVPITPKDKNRLSRLRQDPSVASLLSMYDDHGRLDDHAFSNTPVKSSRLQSDRQSQKSKRFSTLRELLGPTDGGDGLGDISWADGHLAYVYIFQGRSLRPHLHFNSGCDHSVTSISSTSSLGLETPTDALFNTDAFIAVASSPKIADQSADVSAVDSDMTAQYPMISSMEVELSTASDEDDDANSGNTHANQSIIRTPSKRASQVFAFLSERRKRAISEPNEESRQISSVTVEGKIPALDIHATASPVRNADDSFAFTDRGLNLPPPPLFSHDSSMFNVPTPPSPAIFQPLPPPPRPKARSTSAVEVLMAEARPRERGEGRTLKGPRPLPSPANFIHSKKKDDYYALGETSNLHRERSQKTELARTTDSTGGSHYKVFQENDYYTQAPSRLAQRRFDASSRDKEQQKVSVGRKSARQETGGSLLSVDKENTRYTALPSSKSSYELTLEPSTPTKTSPFNLLHSNTYQLPSPASSTELSPEAKQIMRRIRMQKMGTREREKRTLGSINGRILRV